MSAECIGEWSLSRKAVMQRLRQFDATEAGVVYGPGSGRSCAPKTMASKPQSSAGLPEVRWHVP